jgi:hypothetical protein
MRVFINQFYHFKALDFSFINIIHCFLFVSWILIQCILIFNLLFFSDVFGEKIDPWLQTLFFCLLYGFSTCLDDLLLHFLQIFIPFKGLP